MVKLYFKTTTVISKEYDNVPIKVIRLKGDIKFVKKDGTLTKPFKAIIDTGAHTSILSKTIWKDIKKDIKTRKAQISGLNPERECSIPSLLANVAGIMIDETGEKTDIIKFPAFLAKTDRIPLVLGFGGLLEKFDICSDYSNGEAYLT